MYLPVEYLFIVKVAVETNRDAGLLVCTQYIVSKRHMGRHLPALSETTSFVDKTRRICYLQPHE
jgi:hypothetical protein